MLELNKIYCGDCLELMKDIPDKSVDMVLCDLPYGTTACKWDTIIPIEPLWQEYKRVLKKEGAVVLTSAQPFTSFLVCSTHIPFKYEWIWKKSRATGFQNSKHAPMRNHESVLVFYSSRPVFNQFNLKKMNKPISSWRKNGKGGNLLNGVNTYGKDAKQEYTGFHKTVLEIPNEHNKNAHPTQKPVALFEYLINVYTNKYETVLDNCIGSGTTAVACKKTGRNFIGIELSQEYCDMANKRLEGVVLCD